MLLHSHVFDDAVDGIDFPLFSKKPCQVNFLEKLKYSHSQRFVACGHQDYAAFTL
jgi:hypothetical protein